MLNARLSATGCKEGNFVREKKVRKGDAKEGNADVPGKKPSYKRRYSGGGPMTKVTPRRRSLDWEFGGISKPGGVDWAMQGSGGFLPV